MPRRTKVYLKAPWNGGLNSATDSGFMNDNDLVIADNVKFTTNAARVKREGFEYVDTAVPAPDARSSSGTTRSLYFYTNDLQTSTPNEALVAGEKITVTTTATAGNETSYPATAAAISALNARAEVTDVQTIADVGGALDGTYFTLNAGDNGTAYYVWMNVDAGGNDPAPAGKTGIAVAVTTGDSANTIAATMQTAINAEAAFSASVSTDTVTVTAAATGYCVDAADVDTGFTVTITTQGGYEVQYTATGTLAESETTTTTATVVRADSYIRLIDYWYVTGNVKTQVVVACTDLPKFFVFDTSWNRDEVTGTGTPTGTVDQVIYQVFNEKLILSFPAVGDKAIVINGPSATNTYAALGGTPPDFFLQQVHLNRLWTNDKTNKDRLHYSETGDPTTWNGSGDSGAIDVGIGDGDNLGISAIYPTFNGELYVAKGSQLYKITGQSPEEFRVIKVSNGIGCESPMSIETIDQSDVVFISTRGVHSLAATEKFGNIETGFISEKIQPTFDAFLKTRLKYTQSVYIPELNSLVFSFAESGDTNNDNLYLYNLILGAWYRWPNTNCESISRYRDASTNKLRLLIGTTAGRVIRAEDSTFTDFTATPILYRIKTGTIYPDGNPVTIKGFKSLGLLSRPTGRFTTTVKYTIDNLPSQSVAFSQVSPDDTLGTSFVLGQSVLGGNSVFAPTTRTIDGSGRGIVLEITQTGLSEEAEIYGFTIEYEDEDITEEVIGADE